jgi:mutual gliding-motility protein MglA
MPILRREDKQVCFKIIYCGCSGSGRSASMSLLGEGKSAVRTSTRAFGVDLPQSVEFDMGPAPLLTDHHLRARVSTLPRAALYQASLQMLLKNADGIVFVVDSQTARMHENLRAWQQMEAAIKANGQTTASMAILLQYNKRDLPDIAEVDYLDYLFNSGTTRRPTMETIASSGHHVTAAFELLFETVVSEFDQRSDDSAWEDITTLPQPTLAGLPPVMAHSLAEPVASL